MRPTEAAQPEAVEPGAESLHSPGVAGRISPRAALLVLLFASYAYFYQAGGWNQNSRFALVRAITQERVLSIDRFAYSTGDKAAFRGHFYSDKAPGLALSAAIAVACTWSGLTLSYLIPALPPSTAIIVVATGIYLLAFLATSDVRALIPARIRGNETRLGA